MEKIKSILSYIFPIIGGVIVFFITAKEETNTKFHAVQSIVLAILVAIIEAICRIIPFIGGIIAWLFSGIILLVTLIIIINIIREKNAELPVIGEIAKSLLENV